MKRLVDSLTERLVVGFISGVAAALTLVLYPFAIVLLGNGGVAGFDLGGLIYSLVFSRIGLGVVLGTSVIGFCVGSERITSIFSIFWGTHASWAQIGAYLDDKLDNLLRANREIPPWLQFLIIAILAVVVLKLWLQA